MAHNRPGIPGRTGGLNRNTELSALNEIIKRLKALIAVTTASGSLPAGAATLLEQQLQTTELTSLNSNVLSLLNNLVASQDVEILLVRDTGNTTDPTIVVQQIREYDQGTGLWTTRYEKVDGTAYVAPELVGPLEYLDPSAVLNLILVELQTIANEPDYEVIHCYGRDSASFEAWTIESGSEGGTIVPPSSGIPVLSVPVSGVDITIQGIAPNNEQSLVFFDIDKDFSSINNVEVSLGWENTFLQALFGTASLNALQFELVETGGNSVVATTNATGLPVTVAGATGTVILNYDNSSTNYPEFRVRVGYTFTNLFNGAFVLENFLVSTAIDPEQASIKKVDKYEDNTLVSTEYFDYLNTPYTLSGYFIKDDRLEATSLLKTNLANIDANTANLDVPLSTRATEAKQDATIAKLQEILDEPDYEVLKCYGRDTAAFTAWTHGAISSTPIALPSSPPGLGILPGLSQLDIISFNNDYFTEAVIDVDFSTIDLVNVLSDVTFTAGGGVTSVTIQLMDVGTDTILDTQIGMLGVPIGTVETFNFTYDNSTTNFASLKLRILPVGTPSPIYTIVLDNWQYLTQVGVSDPTTAIISRVDKYEDNVLQTTEYFDYLDAPYTLVGTFLKDSSLESTSLMSTSLADIANLDVPLSTRASEVTLLSIDTHLEKKPDIPTYFFDIANGTVGGLPYPNSLDFAFFTGSLTESVTFGPPGVAFNNIDEFVAGFNANVTSIQVLAKSPTEVWVLDGTATADTVIQAGFILNIFGGGAQFDSTTWIQANRADAPTSNLDCILTEAQALAREATLQDVTACKPSYYFSLDNDSFGAAAPPFPFTVAKFEWNQVFPTTSSPYFITPTVVNNTSELADLWNSNVTEAKLIARDSRSLYFISTSLSPWDFTNPSSIGIEDLATYSLVYQGSAGTPWVKDISLFTSNLDSIKDSLETSNSIGATKDKQDAIITELQNILNEPDYELTKCVGFDSGNLLPQNLSNLSFDSLGIGGGAPPTFPTSTSTSFDVEWPANPNYEISFDLGGNYNNVEFVNVFLRVEQAPVNPGTDSLTFFLTNAGDPYTSNVAGATTGSFSPGEVKIIQLSFDNRILQHSSLEVHVLHAIPGTTYPERFSISIVGTTFENYSPADQITEYVKWEDNVQSSVEYRDYLNAPYTLTGFFIKDVNKATEERLSTYLSTIQATNEVLVSNTNRGNLERLRTEANDLVETYLWLDGGLADQRISTITYTSATLALSVTETFTYNGGPGTYHVATSTLS